MMILLGVAGVAWLVGYIWTVVMAFKTSTGWGIGSLCVPLIGLIYCFKNLQTMKTPLIIWIVGIIGLLGGQMMMRAQMSRGMDYTMPSTTSNTTP